jgi:hypothetical protein
MNWHNVAIMWCIILGIVACYSGLPWDSQKGSCWCGLRKSPDKKPKIVFTVSTAITLILSTLLVGGAI